jgi:hypothetical protein
MPKPATGASVVKLLIFGFIALVVVSKSVQWIEAATGHSINELGRPLGIAAFVIVFIIVTVYKVTAFIGVFGGMWITRDVKHVNQYGIDKPGFPMKPPKV